MRTKSLLVIGALLTTLLMPGALTLHAESSTACPEINVFILILGIIEDPDPIPTIAYKMREGIEDPSFGGGIPQRSDGRPDIAFDLQSGWPQVTWAESTGADFDVAMSRWTGESWSGIEFVATSPDDELDPRSYIDSFHKTYVVWWRAGSPDKVFLTTRAAGALGWKAQVEVANDGRRPSVVVQDDLILVAFERDLAAGGQEVLVASIHDDGSITAESIAATSRSERLDAVIHGSGGLLWVDWKNSDSEFAYSVLEPTGWSDPVTVPWSDRSWVGENALRRIIKTEVLSP